MSIVYEANNIQVPATYEEFPAACETIKAAGVIPIVLTGKTDWTVGIWRVTMFPNGVHNDPNLTWEDLNTGKVKFAEMEGFQEVLDVFNESVAKGYVNDDFLARTYDMGRQMISGGAAAMTLQGAWFINECTGKSSDARFSMYPFPFIENLKLASGQYSGFAYSFTDWNQCLMEINFIWLDNFKKICSEKMSMLALKSTLIFAAVTTVGKSLHAILRMSRKHGGFAMHENVIQKKDGTRRYHPDAAVSADLPQISALPAHPAHPAVCSHWKQNMLAFVTTISFCFALTPWQA